MLKISNLSVALNEKKILHHISLDLNYGEIGVIMGPNGSGKSTLASSLMGHPAFTIESGSCLYNGINFLDLPIEQRARAGLFLASQNTVSIPGVQVFTFLREAHKMLSQNQEISFDQFKNKAIKAFEMAGLPEQFLFRNLNDGFSGGEKKRLEIAQMLLFEPKIIILDEIDSGLDSDAIKLLNNAINYLKTNNPEVIILIITHYTKLIEYLNPKVYILNNGRIVKSGDKTLIKEIELNGYPT